MRISTLQIKKFGNINDLKVELKKGINYITGIDDSQTETINQFIYAMFYGISTDKRKTLSADGSDMSGAVQFKHHGTVYRLTRVFSLSDITKDRIVLKNVTDNIKEELSLDIKPGEKILKTDRKSFKKCSFIRKNDMTTSNDLTTSMTNLLTTGNEIISVSGISKTLNSYSDPDNPRNIPGINARIQKDIDSLQEEFDVLIECEQNHSSAKSIIDKLKSDLENYNREYENLNYEITKQELLFQLSSAEFSEKCHNEYKNAEEAVKPLVQLLNDSGITERKASFDDARVKINRVRSLTDYRIQMLFKRNELNEQLAPYLESDSSEAAQLVREAIQNIKDLEASRLEMQNSLKTAEESLASFKEQLALADSALQVAQENQAKFEESSQDKLILAEERLHETSQQHITVEANEKSSNLVLACVLLVVFLLLLIPNFHPIIRISILIAAILCISAIGTKIIRGRKAEKKHVDQIDRTAMMRAEINMRNAKNEYYSALDKYRSVVESALKKIAVQKKNIKDTELHMDELHSRISQASENIKKYELQKNTNEELLIKPDPHFNYLKEQLQNIDAYVYAADSEIYALSVDIINNVSLTFGIHGVNEAALVIDKYAPVIDQTEALYAVMAKYKQYENYNPSSVNTNEIRKKLTVLARGSCIEMMSEAELNALKENAEDIKNRAEECAQRISDSESGSNSAIGCPAVIEKNISSLKLRQENLKLLKTSVEISIDTYNEILLDARKSILPVIARKSSEILKMFTNGNYSAITIKGGKALIKNSEGEPVDIDLNNPALLESIYLSIRLAMSVFMTEKTPLPVFLDGGFLGSEPGNILKTLKNYRDNNQLLIFGKDNTLKDCAAQNNIPLNIIQPE